MMDELRELYQDVILDHGKKPRNFGGLEGYNHLAQGHNPMCGDTLVVYLKVDDDNVIQDVSFKGKGCATCGNLGYKGRMGIYEIMAMSEEIEKVILSGQVSEYDMQRIAMEQGMVSMVQDGILKALDKITTLEEVYSVAE